MLVNGQLQRTAVLALVYDSDENHVRMIFQSLTLANSTNVPSCSRLRGTEYFRRTDQSVADQSVWGLFDLGSKSGKAHSGLSTVSLEVIAPLNEVRYRAFHFWTFAGLD